MGLAAGDYDNDGDIDFGITDIGASRFLENRDASFVDVTEVAGTGRGVIPENGEVNQSIGWGTTFVDLDNDGWLDLYTVAGYIDSDPCSNHPYQPNAVFVNKGDGTFADVSRSSKADDPGIGREVIAADFNNDGLVDLFVVNIGSLEGDAGISSLYMNASAPGNNWLKVKPLATSGNLYSLGARVEVTVDGITMIQDIGLSQGHVSQSLTPAHFGLARATSADSVVIRWLNGAVQSFTNVAANQVLTALEPP
jgi:hypothetical protein